MTTSDKTPDEGIAETAPTTTAPGLPTQGLPTQGLPAQGLPTQGLPATCLRVIGYWIDDDRPDLPDPADHVDANWDLAERQAVAAYLNAGRPIVIGSGCSPCRICGAPNGFEEFTDGVFQWPEGLAHYVLDHSVRLPPELVEHALRAAKAVGDVGLVDSTWWTTDMDQRSLDRE